MNNHNFTTSDFIYGAFTFYIDSEVNKIVNIRRGAKIHILTKTVKNKKYAVHCMYFLPFSLFLTIDPLHLQDNDPSTS